MAVLSLQVFSSIQHGLGICYCIVFCLLANNMYENIALFLFYGQYVHLLIFDNIFKYSIYVGLLEQNSFKL